VVQIRFAPPASLVRTWLSGVARKIVGPGTRRLAAIFAADVAEYSRLMGADEEGMPPRTRRGDEFERLELREERTNSRVRPSDPVGLNDLVTA
jgi:hypothetical protein